MQGTEILLVVAAAIIAVVIYLYFREKMIVKKYSELLDEKGKIEKLSKQVQLDYYKRKLTEDTLRKVLADYTEKIRILEQQIDDIERKHGIKTKRIGFERRAEEKEPVSEEPTDLGKLEGEIR
jgi:DNA transposition AAA+ family ATPase